MRRELFKVALSVATILSFALSSVPVQALTGPQTRGPVSLQIESGDKTVMLGQSAQIKVNISPNSEQELAGCGCNGTCGEDGCDEPSLGCICYGTTGLKFTNYASVSMTNSNPAIASVKYSNGYITVNGLSVGTVTVTATATLRKYDNSDAIPFTIKVTRGNNSSIGTSGINGSSGSPSAGGHNENPVQSGTGKSAGMTATNVSPSAGGTVSRASGPTTASTVSAASASSTVSSASASSVASSAASAVSAASSVESAVTSGTQSVTTVELTSGATGKTQLMDIEGQDKSVIFEKKDGDKLLYFWTFNGKDVTSPADIDMNLTTLASSPIGQALGISGNALYLDFAHSGALPGRATVSVNVGDTYKDGDTIYAYYYDPASKKAELVEKAVTVKDGFASFDITHCSTYFFTSTPLGAEKTVAVLAAMAVLYWILWARKGGKPAELFEKIIGRRASAHKRMGAGKQ